MVNIVRPNETANQGRAGISLGAAAQAGSGTVSIGQQVLSAGRQMQSDANQISLASQMSRYLDSQADKLFADSRRATKTALLLNKSNEAGKRYSQARKERYNQTTDDKGNPTYQNLHKDVEKLGQDIMEETAQTISDPEVAKEFRTKFENTISNQKATALKKGLQQEVEFGQQSLNTGLSDLTVQASDDSLDQLGSYEQEGLNSLQSAYESGIISKDEYDSKSAEFSEEIRYNTLANNINQDRNRVRETLELPAEELGLSEEKKNQLVKTLNAADASDLVLAQKAQERDEIDNLTEEANVVEALESRIEADTLREDELLAVEDKVSPEKFANLKEKYIIEADKRQKERKDLKSVADKIVRGEDISDAMPSTINKLFDYMSAQASDQKGQPLTLPEEALLAASVPSQVPKYAKKLEYAAKYGNLDSASDALSAYTYLKDRNKPTLESGFDSEATKIMERTRLLVERGSMSPTEALRDTRDQFKNINEEIRSTRKSLFRKEKDFKVQNIEETAVDAFGAESFFGTNRITQEAVNTFQKFAEDGYIQFGETDVAISYASEMMKKDYGHSEVGGKKVFMFQPPEKAFPGIPAKTLTNILQNEVAPLLPKGTSPEGLSLHADSVTSNSLMIQDKNGARKIPTWTVQYTKTLSDGTEIQVPLIDPKTQTPVRWTAAGTDYFEKQKQEKLEKAQQDRDRFLSDQAEGRTGRNVRNISPSSLLNAITGSEE